MLCCVVDLNPYQLSCPGSSVGEHSPRLQSVVGSIPPRGSSSSFPLEERVVLGVIDLFALLCLAPLPARYLVVDTYTPLCSLQCREVAQCQCPKSDHTENTGT